MQTLCDYKKNIPPFQSIYRLYQCHYSLIRTHHKLDHVYRPI